MRFGAIAKVVEDSGLKSRLLRQHLLVQNTHDQHPVRLREVKDNMLPMFKSLKSGVNGIASSAEGRVLSQQ